jgi:hypothetical protein
MLSSVILLYLDPGTGSMLIQFLVAAVSAVVFFFSNIKQIFLGFFATKEQENTEKNAANTDINNDNIADDAKK